MNTGCKCTVQRTEDGYLVRLEGRGTRQESPNLQHFVQQALQRNEHVFVDLTACEYLDSTFQGCLVILARDTNKEQRRFDVLVNDSVCRKVFGSSRLEQVLPLIEECPEVVGTAVELPTTSLDKPEFGRHVMETHSELAKLGGPGAAVYQAIAKQLNDELGREADTTEHR